MWLNVHYESHNIRFCGQQYTPGPTCTFIHVYIYMYLIRDLLITNEMKGTKVLTLGAGH